MGQVEQRTKIHGSDTEPVIRRNTSLWTINLQIPSQSCKKRSAWFGQTETGLFYQNNSMDRRMSIELGTLTLMELRKLAGNVEKAIAAAESRQRKDARAAIAKVAKEYGVSIDEILQDDTPKPKRRKKVAPKKLSSAPKYRNPADHSQTWTGKGRRPKWFVDAIDGGQSESKLLI
ncbi:MAG: H-NS histone family protein [Pseudomonadota bacterium]